MRQDIEKAGPVCVVGALHRRSKSPFLSEAARKRGDLRAIHQR